MDLETFFECPKCEPGWFGPGCQFFDARSFSTVTYGDSKTDGNQCKTLNSNEQTQLQISLKNRQMITWVRVEVSDESKANMVALRLQEDEGKPAKRCNQESRLVDGTTVDIICDPEKSDLVKSVEVNAYVNSTCRIFISRGWLVSLKQPANQTSNWKNLYASNAVDGDFETWADTGITKKHSWMVNFNFPTRIFYYFIANRWDECETCKWRLARSSVYYHDALGRSHFVRKIENEKKEFYEYFTPSNRVFFWHAFRLFKTWGEKKGFNVAEVMVYGEEKCPKNKYGLGCGENCTNCHPESGCFVTGACHFCLDDYSGPKCEKQCPAGKSGPNCEKKCSENCEGKRCSLNGSCLQGCSPGWHGLNCEQTCSENCEGKRCSLNGSCLQGCSLGWHGPNCEQTCSENCKGKRCSSNGSCLQGCSPGWQGPACDENCPLGTWGESCSELCADGCAGNGTCFSTNGSCLESCLPGYAGPFCQKQVVSTSTMETSFLLLILAVVLLGLVGVCGHIFTKRRDSTKMSTQEGRE